AGSEPVGRLVGDEEPVVSVQLPGVPLEDGDVAGLGDELALRGEERDQAEAGDRRRLGVAEVDAGERGDAQDEPVLWRVAERRDDGRVELPGLEHSAALLEPDHLEQVLLVEIPHAPRLATDAPHVEAADALGAGRARGRRDSPVLSRRSGWSRLLLGPGRK